ncbi:CotS family spore coat protein [Clostridium manihotivorum]|uniref:CotS family spore coat protein n=1 Tax=Clostridium manihotivorum TaxID=2320868 RepID=A0A410DRM9_9CLOT|nr:CotS family spore coat protein [Clostridium manihotivorum]QAA31739.1 CotS family spore coat protein [Clostridium manihotivorum]
MPKESLATADYYLSEANVAKHVLPFYNLKEASIEQIKLKNTDKQRAVYKVDHNKNTYCLKKVYYTEPDLLFVYSAMEWLYRNGINVPRFLPTINKSRYVNYNDMLFVLTPWVEGEKCDYDNIDNIVETSKYLAKMHHCAKNFIPIPGSKIKKGYDDLYISINKHFQKLLICSNAAYLHKDKFSKIFLNSFDKNIELAKFALEVASTINKDNLTTSLCHGDYVNKNIIFDNLGQIWVIDFDKCSYDYIAHDISYYLRRLLKRDNTKWDAEIAINCIKNYSSINNLTIDDIKYILVYLSFPQKFWRISKDYYNNIKKCNKNSFCNLLEKTVQKTEYQMNFIDELSNYLKKYYSINF